jgi:hypothetical protein
MIGLTDHISKMLYKMGFMEKWIQWIMMCVETVDYSVIVNKEIVGTIIEWSKAMQSIITLLIHFVC